MASILPDDFARRLERHRVPEPDAPPRRRAAVAAVLRGAEAPQVLLMTRVLHARDPWSGHVSLPGGTRSEADGDLLETAIRETREEVGVELERSARLLCRLAAVPAIARGRVVPMDITPYVFQIDGDVRLAIGEEAREAFWFPLERAASGELDDIYHYRDGEVVRELPSWRYEGRVVWGLTYRMLRELLRVVGA